MHRRLALQHVDPGFNGPQMESVKDCKGLQEGIETRKVLRGIRQSGCKRKTVPTVFTSNSSDHL